MSNKNSVQKRAQKRNARAKQKSISNAKGRAAPSAIANRENRRLARKLGVHHLDFDSVLGNAVRQINKGTQPASDAEFKSPQDMIDGLKRNIGEVFKLFSYVALLNGMIEKKIIEHTLVLDLKAIALDLFLIDNRVSRLQPLLEAEQEEVVATECLDIGTTIQNFAEELYVEVTRAEPHALVVEDTLARLREDVEGDLSESEKTVKVLEAISYDYLSRVHTENELEPKPEAAQPEESAEAVAQ